MNQDNLNLERRDKSINDVQPAIMHSEEDIDTDITNTAAG